MTIMTPNIVPNTNIGRYKIKKKHKNVKNKNIVYKKYDN